MNKKNLLFISPVTLITIAALCVLTLVADGAINTETANLADLFPFAMMICGTFMTIYFETQATSLKRSK